jgi:UDP-glucose 4-epimerase
MSCVVVTGASGFIGQLLIPALSGAGYKVRAVTRRPRLVAAASETALIRDLTEPAEWQAILRGADTVIHLAGLAHRSEHQSDEVYDRVNRRTTAQLAAVAKERGIKRVIFVSSIRAQSGPSADHVLTETDAPHPSDAYGRSKLEAELALRAAGVPLTIFRPVVVYGPGVKGNLRTLLTIACSPWPLPLAAFHNRRSMLAIDNFISAVQFALNTPATIGETYLLADDTPVSVAEFIAIVRRSIGRRERLVEVSPALFKAILHALNRPESWERLGGALVVSTAKLRAVGWLPPVDTRTGLPALARGRTAAVQAASP